jgi:hypothetical protein
MSVGAVAMSLSTLIVAVNAQLLRTVKLGRDAFPETAPTQKVVTAPA